MKITTICLIRHGETDWNAVGKLQGRTDIPLNSTGLLQAKECSEFLSNSNWNVIITSPLRRAKQTAEVINGKLKLPIIEMAEFIERSFGEAEGMPIEERLVAFPDGDFPNQEPINSLENRVMVGIQKINQRYNGSKVLLVAHGGVIKAILAALSNGEIDFENTKLINACISNIYFNQEQWKIRDYNQVTHLSHYNKRRGL